MEHEQIAINENEESVLEEETAVQKEIDNPELKKAAEFTERSQLFKLKNEYPDKQDEHMLMTPDLVDVTFDENYEYVIKKPVKKFFSTVWWGFASLVLKLVVKVAYGFRVVNKDIYKDLLKKDTGFITIANHCLVLDCAMVNSVTFPRKVFLPTVHTTLQIPMVRHIIKGFNVIPIPEGIKPMSVFMNEIDALLKNGKIVQFYPESALWPWYDKVREFKTGAFRFAVMNDVPVLPMSIKFVERTGFTKLFTKKPLVRLYIDNPIYPDQNLGKKQAILDLRDKTHKVIKDRVEGKE